MTKNQQLVNYRWPQCLCILWPQKLHQDVKWVKLMSFLISQCLHKKYSKC